MKRIKKDPSFALGSMSGHWPRGIAPSADGAFSLFLVDSGQKTGIKRGVSLAAASD